MKKPQKTDSGDKEAIKLVVWPRETKELNGEKVYWYSVVGMVMTNKPLSFENENELMILGGTNFHAPITDAIEDLAARGEVYEPPYRLGDASQVMSDLGRMNPSELEKATRKKRK